MDGLKYGGTGQGGTGLANGMGRRRYIFLVPFSYTSYPSRPALVRLTSRVVALSQEYACGS